MLDQPDNRKRHDAKPARARFPGASCARWKRTGCCGASSGRSTRTPSCIRWCAGNSRAGCQEDERRAFLFTNVVDGSGRRYDMPVAVGALSASSAQIYAVGMGSRSRRSATPGCDAIANPIAPVTVTSAPCQEVVIKGDELRKPNGGLKAPAGADLDARLRRRALSHRDAVRHQGSRNRRPQHGHLSRRSSKPPTGSACAWRRASAAPAAICTGRNTAS